MIIQVGNADPKNIVICLRNFKNLNIYSKKFKKYTFSKFNGLLKVHFKAQYFFLFWYLKFIQCEFGDLKQGPFVY